MWNKKNSSDHLETPQSTYATTCDSKNRFTFPCSLRKSKADFPVWLFYDISKGRAIVVFDHTAFQKDFPDLLLTQANINKQGKIIIPGIFLEVHGISLNEWSKVWFISVPGRDGKGVIEIYFSDKDFQSVVQYQYSLAEQIANILTKSDPTWFVMVPGVYTPLQLIRPGNAIPFWLSGTATFTT